MTLKGLQELSKNIFSFYLTDDFVSRFWRVANMEQYQNPELYQIFRQIFMEERVYRKVRKNMELPTALMMSVRYLPEEMLIKKDSFA